MNADFSTPNNDRPSQRTVNSLGKVTREYKPSTANQIAGVILSLLLVAGGLALGGIPLFAGSGGPLPVSSWISIALLVLFGLALVAGGVCLFLWVWTMFSFELMLCQEGFYYTKSGEVRVFAWDEIVAVEETVLHEHLPLVKGAAKYAMPTKTSRSYCVKRCDGEEFQFDGNTIQRVSSFAGSLVVPIKNRNIPWTKKEETL